MHMVLTTWCTATLHEQQAMMNTYTIKDVHKKKLFEVVNITRTAPAASVLLPQRAKACWNSPASALNRQHNSSTYTRQRQHIRGDQDVKSSITVVNTT
jgi:hypothetical protein